MENKGVNLAPQVGFEPTTLRLTADTVVAASRCKHNHLGSRKADYRVNWGDSSRPLRIVITLPTAPPQPDRCTSLAWSD